MLHIRILSDRHLRRLHHARSRDVSHNIKWPMHTTIGRAQPISLNRMNFVRRLTSVTKRERVQEKSSAKEFLNAIERCLVAG